jgi:hypothetical protein
MNGRILKTNGFEFTWEFVHDLRVTYGVTMSFLNEAIENQIATALIERENGNFLIEINYINKTVAVKKVS